MSNKRLICIGSGNLSFDIITERSYPEGYSKQKKYSDHILLQEAGGACGNLLSFLSLYGWETYPIARIDTSLVAKQLIADLNRYGVDTRFVFQHIKNDTPVVQYRQDTDKEGNRQVINKLFCSDGLFHRFRPAIKEITKDIAKSDILQSLNFTPDVFHMGHLCPGCLYLAKELKEKGTLILTEVNKKQKIDKIKNVESFWEASDIIICRPDVAFDINNYNVDWSHKLVIQVEADYGIRFNLFGKGWTSLPAISFQKVDEEGGMEWLMSTFLQALVTDGCIDFPNLDYNNVSSALRQAQEQAIKSMTLLGAKSIVYQENTTNIPPSTYAEDILCITDEVKEKKKHGRITLLEHIPAKDYREYDKQACHAYRSDFDCVNGIVNHLEKCNPLSNFYPCNMQFEGKEFSSAEQLFHYLKFEGNTELQNQILEQDTPTGVMYLCRNQQPRPDHDRVRWMNMTLALETKYIYCPEFREIIRNSGDTPLVEVQEKFDIHGATVDGEHRNVKGSFKGRSTVGKYVGMNGVGRCMMAIREQFKDIVIDENYTRPTYGSLDEWWNRTDVYPRHLDNMGKHPLNPHGIMGAICGDILGAHYEFNATKDYNFQLFPPQSRWTDDTAMTIALARWLLGERTPENLVNHMVKIGTSYPNAGFGGRFKRWLHSEDHPTMGSFGNGSAMRVSPVGLIATSLEEALSLAEMSARVSHDHPEGIQGAQAVAAAIYLARTGSSKNEIKEYISSTFGYDLNRTTDEIRPTYKFEKGCAKTVPESMICWLESETYEETIRKAISLGGDADTMACIAGSIAAATPGMGIPDEILQRSYTYLGEDFAETVWAFDKACNRK